jgi:hypothetical protein
MTNSARLICISLWTNPVMGCSWYLIYFIWKWLVIKANGPSMHRFSLIYDEARHLILWESTLKWWTGWLFGDGILNGSLRAARVLSSSEDSGAFLYRAPHCFEGEGLGGDGLNLRMACSHPLKQGPCLGSCTELLTVGEEEGPRGKMAPISAWPSSKYTEGPCRELLIASRERALVDDI